MMFLNIVDVQKIIGETMKNRQKKKKRDNCWKTRSDDVDRASNYKSERITYISSTVR